MCFIIVHKKIKSPETVEFQGFSFGGDKRDRTADLLNAMQYFHLRSVVFHKLFRIFVHNLFPTVIVSYVTNFYILHLQLQRIVL